MAKTNYKEPLIKTNYKSKKSLWRRSIADDSLDHDGLFMRTKSLPEMYDSDHMQEYFSYQGTPRGSYKSPSFDSSSSQYNSRGYQSLDVNVARAQNQNSDRDELSQFSSFDQQLP